MSIDTQAYLFVHFIGEERNPTDEQLYFALSRDGVHWKDSAPGRQSGVDVARRREGRARPASSVRDPRGGFHIVATDLSIYYRGGWGPNDGATTNGSTGLVIWDSPDLVHWSEPRLVDVASKIPDAGMAWAPEANWGSESRAVDRVLVHEEQRRKLRGIHWPTSSAIRRMCIMRRPLISGCSPIRSSGSIVRM